MEEQQFQECTEESALKYRTYTRQLVRKGFDGKDISQEIDTNRKNHCYAENGYRLERQIRTLRWIETQASLEIIACNSVDPHYDRGQW